METMMLEIAMQTGIQQLGNEVVHLSLIAAVVTVVLLSGAWMAAGLLRPSREL